MRDIHVFTSSSSRMLIPFFVDKFSDCVSMNEPLAEHYFYAKKILTLEHPLPLVYALSLYPV